MGGSQPSPPPAPIVQKNEETTRQAIQAQIDATPDILRTQQEYGPQFQQQELDQFRQFGSQQTDAYLDIAEEHGGRLNALARAEQESLAPERVAGSDAIKEFLDQGPEELTDYERDKMLEDVRAAQQTRGLAMSGMGAVDELKKVTGLRQALKDRYLNIALSASGRLPSAGASSVAAPNTSTQQLVQNVDPATFFGGQASVNNAQSSIYSTQGSIFGAQSQAATQRRAQNIGMVSDGLGAAMMIAGCWVAKEIFGSWEHPKTAKARFFIANQAPKWFREFYYENGEEIAEFISDKPFLKALLRPLFEFFAVAAKGEILCQIS